MKGERIYLLWTIVTCCSQHVDTVPSRGVVSIEHWQTELYGMEDLCGYTEIVEVLRRADLCPARALSMV